MPFKKIIVLAIFLLLAVGRGPLAAAQTEFSKDDRIFLEKIQRRALDYFMQESNRENGLVRDYAFNKAGQKSTAPASIAASGFALSAYAIGAEHGWIMRSEAI